jgi:hypothetical protein
MLRMCVYMHSRFIENHPIRILEDDPSFLRWFCHNQAILILAILFKAIKRGEMTHPFLAAYATCKTRQD